mmetsp:Transcript_87187/g.247539  ORF Transcript_87187/g.247539 Transcript_87187/m.247539 type:complete len:654 (-) Transcript_87187:105-2066(-)
MNLGYNELTGSLPSQLGQMTAMKTAYSYYVGFVNSNDFGGSQIPTQFGYMTAFTSMGYGLYSAGLGGTVPSELGCLSILNTDFRVNNNDHTGTVPTELGQLTGITANFFVSVNQYTSSPLPTEIGQLTSVKTYLGLLEMPCTGTLPTEIGNMVEMISRFKLNGNSFSSTIPTQIGRLTKMVGKFDLSSNMFTGDVPTEVQALSSGVTDSWQVTTGNSIGTYVPTQVPIPAPTTVPIPAPTTVPIPAPTAVPIPAPSPLPSFLPSALPSALPTSGPTVMPGHPSRVPLPAPSPAPTIPAPSVVPVPAPSAVPVPAPSAVPVPAPTAAPQLAPSSVPMPQPTAVPSPSPTPRPTLPSPHPTLAPSSVPTPHPTPAPSSVPTTPGPMLAPTIWTVPTLAPSANTKQVAAGQADSTTALLGALGGLLSCGLLYSAWLYKRRSGDEGRKPGARRLAAEVELGHANVGLKGTAVAQFQGPWVIDSYLLANVVDGKVEITESGEFGHVRHPPSAICATESGEVVRTDGWSVAPGSDPIDGPVVWTKDGAEVVWARPGGPSSRMLPEDWEWDPSHADGRDQDWDPFERDPSHADAQLSHSRSLAVDDAAECYTFNMDGFWGGGLDGAKWTWGAAGAAEAETDTGTMSARAFICADSTQPAF